MKELMDIKRWGQSKWRMPLIVAVLAVVIIGSIWLNVAPFRSGFEITDELGGNIFPSSILSVATTDAQVIVPADSMFVGNPKSCIAVKVRSAKAYSRATQIRKLEYRLTTLMAAMAASPKGFVMLFSSPMVTEVSPCRIRDGRPTRQIDR